MELTEQNKDNTDAWPRPMSAQAAADYLGLSYRHVCRLARAGQLPATKRGHKWYFSPTKLRDWAGV